MSEPVLVQEIEAAARWWADQLRGPPAMDVGDEFLSSFASSAARGTYRPIPEEQVLRFEHALRALLHSQCDESARQALECGVPLWASLRRTIGVDYHPDRPIREALAAAGIEYSMLLFSFKTTMWINPGSVRVAQGYRAVPVPVWTEEA